ACPFLPHLKHSPSFILRLNSSSGRQLNLLLLVASRSIASPPWVVVVGRKVPLSLLGGVAFEELAVWVGPFPWMFLNVASLHSFLIAQSANICTVSCVSLSTPQASCILVPNPLRNIRFNVPSSAFASVAVSLKRFQYSVTESVPWCMFSSFVLAFPSASFSPNCSLKAATNSP